MKYYKQVVATAHSKCPSYVALTKTHEVKNCTVTSNKQDVTKKHINTDTSRLQYAVSNEASSKYNNKGICQVQFN